jgi:hypothetical protein
VWGRPLSAVRFLDGASASAACGKTRFICGQRPSAAKAGLILWNLAARLEAAPFQNGLQTALFRELFSAAMNALFWNGGFATEVEMGIAREFFRSLPGIILLCPQSQAPRLKNPIAAFVESKPSQSYG